MMLSDPDSGQDDSLGVRVLWKESVLVVLVLIAQVLKVPYVAAGTMAVLIAWACRGARSAVQATTVSVILTLANPALIGDQSLVPLLKWLLLFVSLARILLERRPRPGTSSRWFGCFAAFALVAFCLAVEVSGDRSLSLQKLASFAVGVLVALIGVTDRGDPPRYWLNWFTTVYLVVLLLSAPLIFLPAGRNLNGTGFQGIFSHPQTYGVYAVPITVYLTVTFLVKVRGSSRFLLAVLPWAWYSIFASGCRTALLAVGLSAAATAGSMVLLPRTSRSLNRGRPVILTVCFVGLVALAVFSTSANELMGAFGEFITKGGRVGTIGSSRQSQIDALLASIEQNLITGVGFGLSPAALEQVTERDELTGLAVSAPSEQGFLPLAVLNQLGILGAVPLLLFFATLAFPVAKYGTPAVVGLFWTALFINFGEMIFFSNGGLGMYMWLLFACCYGQSRTEQRLMERCG